MKGLTRVDAVAPIWDNLSPGAPDWHRHPTYYRHTPNNNVCQPACSTALLTNAMLSAIPYVGSVV